ncbi:LTA synthase family protein [Clostridium culturomicium]|uniref:LTA synthase family protein n=1 Tax=Clostridium culturomicium TaxID=1499683 RepID=UPI00385782EB
MKKLMKKIFTKDNCKTLVMLMLLATFINLIIECFNRASLFKGFGHMLTKPQVFFYNVLVILITLSITFLTRRRVFVATLLSILWIGFGITNFIILSNRVTPFTATDFTLLGDGTTILTKYFNGFQIGLVIVAAILLVVGLVSLWRRAPIYKNKISYLRNIVIVGIITVVVTLFTQVALSTNVLAANFGNIADAYKDYGFVYCFVNSLVNTGMNKPKDYSPTAIDEITSKTLESKKKVETEVKKPNIIMLQLESLFDVTTLKDVKFSKDPLPNLHKLSSEFTSGYLTVPSIGAGTANTEFEAITGMNLDFFGPGEYPYKTILKETTAESAAYNLKELGYGTHAIHNNDGTFYGRNKVFANLGFDTFTSLEYMNPIEENPTGWAKDKILIKEILNTLKSTEEQDYIYTISVQGHGKYPNNPSGDLQSDETSDEATNEAAEEALHDAAKAEAADIALTKEQLLKEYSSSPDYIKVDGFDEEKDYAFEYYVNQIHEMDQFVADLINELSKTNEDVVLVLFGDHLPTFGIEQEDLAANTLYDTPYVIWDNMNLPKKDKNLEAYQLNAYVLEQLNIDNGTLTKLHQNERDNEDYLSAFELLQYDMLYGKREIYGEVNPFEPTDIKMGIYDEKLTKVIEEEDRIVVKGEYFTPYSRVLINDEIIDTIYVSPNEVSIEKHELHQGDLISVGQVDGNYVLSKTNEYIYGSN